jgi:ParB family chromosome partitioning protein
VLAQHQKGRPWLSKLLSLLDLPEQAKRIVSENISADVEVINTVKTIEKADPAKAKTLVDELSKGRGKVNAREKVAAVKEEVKPSKRQKPAKDAKGVATAKDRSQEEPSAGDIFAGAKSDPVSGDAVSAPAATTPSAPKRPPVAFSRAEVLNNAYTNIYEHGSNPKTVLETMSKEDQEGVEGFLFKFYEAGKQSTDPGRDVIRGFRKGHFSSDGDNAFAMLAFLSGADEKSKFNVLNILGSVKDD